MRAQCHGVLLHLRLRTKKEASATKLVKNPTHTFTLKGRVKYCHLGCVVPLGARNANAPDWYVFRGSRIARAANVIELRLLLISKKSQESGSSGQSMIVKLCTADKSIKLVLMLQYATHVAVISAPLKLGGGELTKRVHGKRDGKKAFRSELL